jgi:hypothetical protein
MLLARLWAITTPMKTRPVTAMTTFFPIMVLQKAITAIADNRAWCHHVTL